MAVDHRQPVAAVRIRRRNRLFGRPNPPLNQRRDNRTGWLFVLPFMVVFVLFTGIPVIMAFGLSLTDASATDVRNLFAVDFVGFDNFKRLVFDPAFLRAVLNTAIFLVLTVPVCLVGGLILALVLNQGIRRLRGFFRAAIYMPVITNIVAAAIIWQYAFSLGGPINEALVGAGLPALNWLGEPALAVPTVALLGIWRNLGMCMVLFLAGLQAIPREIEEASSIDGAGYFRHVIHMTVPLLRPTTLLVTVLMTVAFLNIFDEPYLVTNGGPLGSTRSIALWVYQQFGYGNIAASMTGSFILLAVVAVIAFVQFRVLRPKQ